MKKKRIFSTIAALSLAGIMLFSATGCETLPLPLPWGSTSSGGGTTPGGDIPVEEEPYVEELVIVTEPIKKDYRLYEVLNTTGMTLVAKWSHGVEEDLHPAECKISTKLITAGVDKITFTYEGQSVDLALNVDQTEIQSVTFDHSSISTIQMLGNLDLSKVVAKIKYVDGEVRTSTDLTIKEDGKLIKKPAAYMLKEVGIHEYEMNLGEYSSKFTVMAQPGRSYEIARGELVAAADVDSYQQNNPGKSFVEVAEGGAGYVDSQGKLYIGGTSKGTVLRLHVWSEEARTSEFLFTAASSLVLGGTQEWVPTLIGDMLVNGQLEMYHVTSDESGDEVKTLLTVDDSVVFPGSSSEEPDPDLWLNFTDISYGEVAFAEGDNIFELKIISESINMFNANCAINVLGFKVLDQTTDCEHKLEKVTGVTGKCGEYSTLDYWRCEHCLRTYADENGEERVYNVPLKRYVEHVPGAAATCKEPQKCTECGEPLTGLGSHQYDKDTCDEDCTCLFCGDIIPAGHNIKDDGNVRSCERCGEVLGYYYDVTENNYIKYYTADGNTWTPSLSWNTLPSGVDAPLHQINDIGGLDNRNWKGGTMRITVNATQAGTYDLKFRFQSVGGAGMAIQDVSQIFEYCVNPTGDASTWTYTNGQGKVQPATVTKDWSDFWYWSIVDIGDINLVKGENQIVVRFKASFSSGGPNVGGVLIEKSGYEYFGEATMISTKVTGTTFTVGDTVMATATGDESKSYAAGIFMRVAVPADQRAEFGSDYYDFILTADMLAEAIDTTTAGEKSVKVTAEKFGKTFTATLYYTVVEAA